MSRDDAPPEGRATDRDNHTNRVIPSGGSPASLPLEHVGLLNLKQLITQYADDRATCTSPSLPDLPQSSFPELQQQRQDDPAKPQRGVPQPKSLVLLCDRVLETTSNYLMFTPNQAGLSQTRFLPALLRHRNYARSRRLIAISTRLL